MFVFRKHLARFSRISTHFRALSKTTCKRHENPLGLPRRPLPPQMPRKGGPIEKRKIAHVDKVIVVASGKGGVGKSTIAMNLAFQLAQCLNSQKNSRIRVGILDLDIFGPSIPTLMGLRKSSEPSLSDSGAILPLVNHGLPCMSMGFLISAKSGEDNTDMPIVWRGLMVQKAVQQLLFDVDWSGEGNSGLDALIIDMPPGTGDVPLTLGQLVQVDDAVIVSTPQDVSLSDVRKGIAMFKKVSVPISGLVLNQSYYLCPGCNTNTPRYLFGKPDNFHHVAQQLDLRILGELPVVEGVGSSSDAGYPYVIKNLQSVEKDDGSGGLAWRSNMENIARNFVSKYWI